MLPKKKTAGQSLRRVLILLALCSAAPGSRAQNMTVVVIDGKSGKPMMGRWVVVSGQDRRLYPQNGGHLGPVLTPKNARNSRTGRDGAIRFSLQGALPRRLFVDVGTPDEVTPCQRPPTPLTYDTDEALATGIVGVDTCDTSGRVQNRFQPEPGRIIVFWRKLTFREKWCREMVLFCW